MKFTNVLLPLASFLAYSSAASAKEKKAALRGINSLIETCRYQLEDLESSPSNIIQMIYRDIRNIDSYFYTLNSEQFDREISLAKAHLNEILISAEQKIGAIHDETLSNEDFDDLLRSTLL